MMRNNLFVLSIFVALIMVSCVSTPHPAVLDSPITETPRSVKTPTETPSPIPLSDLEGALFFDYNGNGLKDEAEPVIVGFGICTKIQEQEVCVNSDTEGKFRFGKIAPPDSEILLRFTDPNKDIPSLAFRYINIWKAEIILAPYELNNINVPEQHLNDTSTILLNEGITTKAGSNINIGLMQGIVTLPLNPNGLAVLNKVMGFDQDISGGVMDFTGSTYGCGAPWECNKPASSQSPYIGTGNSHRGIDYGAFNSPTGIPFFAAHAGYVAIFIGDNAVNGSRALCVNISTDKYINGSFDYPKKGFLTSYQHAANLAVKDGDYVYRGQFLGFVGNTGTQWTHLHFEIDYGKAFERNDETFLYNKDFYAMNIPEYIKTGFNDISIWTVWNSPQQSQINFPSVEYSPKP
jgi:hypothetical protein